MAIRKLRLIGVAGFALMLTFTLVGGAVAAKPEPAGGLRWIGVVAFDDTAVNEAAREAIVKGVGGVIEKDLEHLNMAIVLLPNVRMIEKEKGVRWVEADSYRYYHLDPPPPLQPLPWGVDRIDAEYAWTGSTGDGVNVAVLDTGIDTNHPDLAANLEGGYSAVNRDTTNVEDKNGHGTHVSGTIAALNNDFGVVGVGPAIDLYAVQISRGAIIRLTDILEGINWCVGTLGGDPDDDIQVMNMSYGGGYSKSEDDALQTAYEAGIVLVSSAGNEGGEPVTYPAALPQVIAVSATDRSDDIAWFSSTGSQVELAAPGVSIYSTYKGGSYETLSGTSMAGPHVAGVAALYIASNPGSTPEQVRLALQTSAEDLGATGKDNLYGYGLVDAENAVLGTTSGDNLPVAAVTDIAITAVTAVPESVMQGEPVEVSVTVENIGNQDVTTDINVTLTDDTDSVTIGTQTILGGLAADASTTLTFSWDTSSASPGDHTLTASHNFADDDASNDSRSTTVSVTEEAAVTVTSIDPNTMLAGTTISVTITGSGFVTGADVTFESGSGPAPTASNVFVVDANTITATVTAKSGGPPRNRVWDVRVTNPDGSPGVLPDGFTVAP